MNPFSSVHRLGVGMVAVLAVLKTAIYDIELVISFRWLRFFVRTPDELRIIVDR